MGRPKWLGEEKSTRDRSYKQEKRLAKKFGGRPTANSGARFGENDVKTDEYSIEAKTTGKKQFTIKQADLDLMEAKTPVGKIPLFAINFEQSGKEYILLSQNDFLTLTSGGETIK